MPEDELIVPPAMFDELATSQQWHIPRIRRSDGTILNATSGVPVIGDTLKFVEFIGEPDGWERGREARYVVIGIEWVEDGFVAALHPDLIPATGEGAPE